MSLKLGLRNKIRRNRAAGGFVGLLDQPFAQGATAAYSLRRLKSTATKAVRVREDSGNTEADIGFSGGTLDTTALLNHVGSNNGFVTKWYDQSGNGNDASNSTATEQPKIYDANNGLVKENGKAALDFNQKALKAGNILSLQTSGTKSSVYFISNPVKEPNPAILNKNNEYVLGFNDSTGGNSKIHFRHSTFGGNSGILSDDTSIDTQYLFSVLSTAGTGGEIFKNGSLYLNHSNQDTSSATNNALIVGDNDGDHSKIQEIIVYKGVRHSSTNRDNIETNINSFYSVF